MSIDYERIPLSDNEESIDLSNVVHAPSEIRTVLISSRIDTSSIGNDYPIPLSRPPTKGRDKLYAILFFLQFVVIALFSLLERSKIANNLFLLYSRVGNWTSMIMISTILGSFFGSLVIFLISNSETRIVFISQSISISILILVCLANILIFDNQVFMGIFLFIVSFYFISRYKACKDSIHFTNAVIGLVCDISNRYGNYLALTCGFIVFLHTCLLLGWVAYLVNLFATLDPHYTTIFLITMILSLYWITKFFHGFIAHIIGGCIVWYFIRDDQEIFLPHKRLMLHLQCACSTSLGSLCKGALLSGLSDFIIVLHMWSSNYLINNNENSSQNERCRMLKRLVAILITPFLKMAFSNHRLGFVVTAVYGQTFRKASEHQLLLFPQTVEFSLTSVSNFNLTCVSVEIAGLITLAFGLLTITSHDKSDAEGVLLTIIYLVAYFGVSLCVEVYKAALDGLIVSFSLKPDKLASANQIIFLRFLRMNDTSLR